MQKSIRRPRIKDATYAVTARKMGGMFSRVGWAAKRLAADSGETMAALRGDVRETKEHYIRVAWPRVNETLSDMQAVLKVTQTFVSTGTFTMKVLAMLLIVCALYTLSGSMQNLSFQWHRNAHNNWQSCTLSCCRRELY